MNDYSQDALRGRITETSPGVFKADSTIIKSVESARAVYLKLRTNSLRRINLYTEIEGLIQGNPPYNPSELRAAGLQHIANFNDMSARAIIKRACLAYWNLLHNVEHMSHFRLRLKDPQAVHFADVMSQHWDYAVRENWASFNVNVASLSAQLVKFGICPILFPDERDPRWRVVELHRFYVPDQAQSDLDLLTTALVETEFTVQYLWGVFSEFKGKSKEEQQKKSPWNVKELGRLLVWLSQTPNKEISSDNLFELERKLYSGDITFDRLYNDTVRVVSLFQKEYNGKISHYMFHRSHSYGVSMDGAEEFLFFQQDQYQNMQEALVLFTKDPGEFTIHANRGLGHEIYSLAQAKIMLDCSVVDMAKWASTPIIKSPSLNAKDVDQIKFYPGVATNIGTAEFIQNNLGANVDNVVGAAQYLSNLIQFNMTYSGTDPASPDPDKGSLSPSQVRLMAFREFSVLKQNIMHFYTTFDRLIRNMTIKMLRAKEGYPGYEMARCWKERCIEDGVPSQIFDVSETDPLGLPRHIEVCATRAAGAGSQVAHLIGLQELQAIAGSFGPRAENWFKQQYVMATIGPEYVDPVMQDAEDADERAGGASLAGVENAIIQMGKSPIFSGDNDQRSHIVTHLTLGTQVAQALQQQQIDPVEADRLFTVLIPHTAEHMKAVEGNVFAQDFFAKTKPTFDQVAKVANLNRQNAMKILQTRAQEQQDAMASQQRVMNEEELKNMQASAEERRKDLKLAAQSQRQENAGRAKEEALSRKVEGELAIKREKALGEVGIAREQSAGQAMAEGERARHEMMTKTQKTEHEIVTSAAKTATDIELSKQKAASEAAAARDKGKKTE